MTDIQSYWICSKLSLYCKVLYGIVIIKSHLHKTPAVNTYQKEILMEVLSEVKNRNKQILGIATGNEMNCQNNIWNFY